MSFWKRLFGKKDGEITQKTASPQSSQPSKSCSSQPTSEPHPPIASSIPDFPSYKVNDDPSRSDRVIRVFLSSTFRDMMEERDYLVKFTFPKLRKLCESRGVIWGEVDLRWGVSDEQKADGKVLPICLEEIKRCRPYFIGLLGERYGWLPESIPAELLDMEPWLKEQFERRKSVTELEILHGVLRNPEMAGHAYFYFRDPQKSGVIEEELKKEPDYRPDPPDSAVKLEFLKENIRHSGFPVRENYPTPEALGELVLKDLTAVIDQFYPEGSQPDPLDREAMDHEAYARSRAQVYISRAEYFKCLDEHATGQGDQPLVIMGESGSGKSALLANWAIRYRQDHPDILVIQHYIGASPYSADWAAMIRRIMGEFKRRLGIQQEIPDQPDTLRSAFANWLSMAAAKGRVILVLDALNQLEDRDGAPDLVWLPPVIPSNIRLALSTLPGRPLEELKKRNRQDMTVQPFNHEEKETFIAKYLAQFTKTLSPAHAERIASTRQTDNPLYLQALLEELRVFGIYEKLDKTINHYLEAQTIPDLYQRILKRYETDYERDRRGLVREVMLLIWAARRGLSESELLEILGSDGSPLPRAIWSSLYLAARQSLVDRSGFIGFSHNYFRQAVHDKYLTAGEYKLAAHIRLADYFEMQDINARKVDELPYQLAEGGAWQRLEDLLTDRDFFMPAWDANQFDVKGYWALLEDRSYSMVQAYSRAAIDNPDKMDYNFIWCTERLFADAGHPIEALMLRESLTEELHESGDMANYGASLGIQAIIHSARGELDEAMKLHKEEEQICRELGNRDGLSVSLLNQANIHSARGDLDDAMRLYKEQERICRELGNKDRLSASLLNQANIHSARGDLDEAMRLYKEQERICKELGNKDRLSDSLLNQANIHFARGDLDAAMRLYKEQEQICRELGRKDGQSASLGGQALILQARGDLAAAMRLYKEQEQICRELGSKYGLFRSLGNQAGIHTGRGELDEAMRLNKEAVRICRDLGNKDNLSISLGNQARIHSARGELDEAMRLHNEEERICRELGDKDGLQASLHNQALILKDRGELDEAMRLYKEEEQICRELGNKDGLSISLAYQAQLLAKEMNNYQQALPLAEESYRIAMEYGLDGFKKQAGSLLAKIRSSIEEAPVIASTPHVAADPEWSAQLNIKYREELKN